MDGRRARRRAAASSPSARSGARASALAMAGLLLFTTALSVYTINRDTVPMVADAAGYYRTTLVLHRLLEQGRGRAGAALLLRGDLRPPLPQLVTTATYLLLGERSQRVARLSMLPFWWLLLLATYGIGARFKDPPTGLVAAALLAGFPQVIGFSRSYWMDVPLAAMTTAALWALLGTDGLRRRGRSVLFGLALGLGLLTKYTFPVFIGGPAVYLAAGALRRARRAPARQRRRALLLCLESICLALLVATALAAFWYVPTLGSAWRNFVFNRGALVLWPRPAWTLSNLTLYARHLGLQLGPWLWLLLAALPLVLLARRPVRVLLLLWVGLPYLFFTYLVLGIEWARFTLPYLPALALVMALGLMQLRLHRPLRGLGYALGVGALLGNVALTFGSPAAPGSFPWQRVQGRGLLAPQGFDVHLPLSRLFPSDRRRWAHVALAPDVGSLASVLETVALEHGQRLRVSVPYEPEAHGFRRRFPFPQRVGDPEYLRAFDYLVWVEVPRGVRPPARRPDLYRQSLAVWQEVQSELVLSGRVTLPGGYALRIYRPGR
jgi:4-amino-4-deoxy-L-arabinose transferase-like glycosyltransferase